MKLACGCGNFKVEWDVKPRKLIARKCGCDYCIYQNATYVSDPETPFSYQIKHSDNHQVVKHGSGTAEFNECGSCGLVLVTSKIEGELYGVLNVNALDIEEYSVDPKIKDFADETVEFKLNRRKKNWSRAFKSFQGI